jgi:hypothetical protein
VRYDCDLCLFAVMLLEGEDHTISTDCDEISAKSAEISLSSVKTLRFLR